jgi:hypothetical protein
MKIQIAAIADGYIAFNSPLGNGVGRCQETGIEVGGSYGVEFDFDVVLSLAEHFISKGHPDPSISWNGQHNIICGRVESIDQDEDVCLRLSPDCIIVFSQQVGMLEVGDIVTSRIPRELFRVSVVGR